MATKEAQIKAKTTNAIYTRIESMRPGNNKKDTIRSWERAAQNIKNNNNANSTEKYKADELLDALSMMEGGRKKTRTRKHKQSKHKKTRTRKHKHNKSCKH
jgi:hypothetical protein